MKRLLIVDLLRIFAAFSVFITHVYSFLSSDTSKLIFSVFYRDTIEYLSWANEGLHFGVIIFIVLSGFIIHYPSLKASSTYSGKFWVIFAGRRLFRILPVYITAVILGIISYKIIQENPISTSQIVKYNFLVFLQPFYGPDRFDFPLNNIVLGTVIVEIYLYILLYPILVFIRKNFGDVGIIIFLVAAIFLYLLSYFIIDNPEWFAGTFYIFLIYWTLGFFAAEISFRGKNLDYLKWWLIPSFLVYFTSRFIAFSGAHFLKSIYLAMIISLLIVVFHSKLNTNKWVARISDSCYSVYAVHWPAILVLSFCLQSPDLNSMIKDLILIIGSIFFIIIIYKVVEQPSHFLARKLFRPNKNVD